MQRVTCKRGVRFLEAPPVCRMVLPALMMAQNLMGSGGDDAGGKSDKKPTSINEVIGKVTKSVKDAVRKAPRWLLSLVTNTALLLSSCQTIAIFLVCFFVVAYIIFVLSPRPAWFNRAVDIEGYSKGYAKDLLDAAKDLQSGLSSGGFFAMKMTDDDMRNTRHGAGARRRLIEAAERLRNAANKVLAHGDMEDDIPTFLKFYDNLTKGNWLHRSDMRSNARMFVTDGDLDGGAVRDFKSNVVIPVMALLKAGENMSKMMDGMTSDLREMKWWGAPEAELVAQVHTVRMLADYRSAVTDIYKTRRDKMPAFVMWTVYYGPYVEDIYTHRIPEIWKKSMPRYAKIVVKHTRWWADLGTKIGMMPCHMAFSDPAERAANCKPLGEKREGFTQQGMQAAAMSLGPLMTWVRKKVLPASDEFMKESKKRSADDGAPDEEEPFIGIISGIANFFYSFRFMAKIFQNAVKEFDKDPMGAILNVVGVVLGLIFGLWLMLVHLWLTITAIFFILMVIWCIIEVFVWAIIVTLWLILISTFMAIPYFFMWLVDMMTNGFLSRMMRCENLPDAWVGTPNFSEDNVARRIFPLCYRPCSVTKAPNGMTCATRKPHLPDYCPQQQIYRMYRGQMLMGGMRPPVMDLYKPPPGFGSMQLSSKQSRIVKAYGDKVEWYQKCFKTLSGFNYMNRHICANADLMPKVTDVSMLRRQCTECFCDYAKGKSKVGDALDARMTGDGERNNPFCRRLRGEGSDAIATNEGVAGAGTELLRKALTILLIVICMLVVMYGMRKAAGRMMQEAMNSVAETAKDKGGAK